MFNDSIENNLEVLRELLIGMPPTSRDKAKRAAVAIEKAWNALHKDNPKDPAVALGAAFAVYTLAQRMLEQKSENDGPLIQLLG
jgi:hypothetical protein